jgi:hypothetical protein
VLTPASGDHVGIGGIDLLVKFPPEVAFGETFRALLNGADVTDQLTTGENGSSGRLVDLLPGENRLRLEIFGRVPWAPDEVFRAVARAAHLDATADRARSGLARVRPRQIDAPSVDTRSR